MEPLLDSSHDQDHDTTYFTKVKSSFKK